MTETRIPIQKRSIEKRNRIIEKGFEIICNNGFHNTNSVDIAKYVGVSTGIIYQYFKDKEEIFTLGIKKYSINIMYPVISILKDIKLDNTNILSDVIDKCVDSHIKYKKAHEELIAMSHQSSEIEEFFNDMEIVATAKVINILKDNNINLINAYEKVHISLNLVDYYCHEVVYHNHKEINYDNMKIEIINIIKNILKESSN